MKTYINLIPGNNSENIWRVVVRCRNRLHKKSAVDTPHNCRTLHGITFDTLKWSFRFGRIMRSLAVDKIVFVNNVQTAFLIYNRSANLWVVHTAGSTMMNWTIEHNHVVLWTIWPSALCILKNWFCWWASRTGQASQWRGGGRERKGVNNTP